MSRFTPWLALTLAGCAPCRSPEPESEPPADPADALRTTRPHPGWDHVRVDTLPEGEPALVVLVVLDTVRADHTSLCGYDRPTTPLLAELGARARASTCRAYAPAAWTLPSHASYFTGVDPLTHDVLAPGAPLAASYETLAETFGARGYQTRLVSANPTLGVPAPGLDQGFERSDVAARLVSPLRARFGPTLAAVLDDVDRSAPLFLVVNLFDAHDPFPPIPKGVPWARPQGPVAYNPWDRTDANPYHAFVTRSMPEPARPRWLARVRDGYDHGIRTADRHLGGLLKHLADRGWLARPHRIAIVSDHGEYLGERGLLRHGSGTFEPVTRVPLVFIDTTADGPLALPEPVSATVVHGLLRDGRLPEPLPPVAAAAARQESSAKPSWDMVSVWGDDDAKLTWMEGKRYALDLAADPEERQLTPVPEDHPLSPALSARIDAFDAARTRAGKAPPTSEAAVEALRALGYVE